MMNDKASRHGDTVAEAHTAQCEPVPPPLRGILQPIKIDDSIPGRDRGSSIYDRRPPRPPRPCSLAAIAGRLEHEEGAADAVEHARGQARVDLLDGHGGWW